MINVAVVGASGPLGTFLTEHLALTGHGVRPLARRSAQEEHRVDVLSHPPHPALAGATGVVYCAWDTADRSSDRQQAHVAAAGRWARASADAGLPFIFTSTVLAARVGSSYGVHKRLAEEVVAEAGGTSLRIGLVTDDAYPFLATRLRHVGRRLPMIASLLDVPVFAVGSTTLGRAVAAELAAPRVGQVVWLAPERPCSLRDLVLWDPARGARRPSSAYGGRLLRLAAALPLRGGAAGRHVDALTGLLARPVAVPGMLRPIEGAVRDDAWQEVLRGR